jgi:DNA polymerase-3 subunit alpha
MLNYAGQLEGLLRNASTHAAGVVIGDRPLDELVPLYRDPRSDMPATQFNMKWVEPAGLVKFDFLGLKTLTVIDKACQLLAQRGIHVDPAQIPFEDEPTYKMMAHGDTTGVFQFESAGMRDLLRKAVPTVFEDLIAIVALFRPGPMENIPKYLDCKHGREAPEDLHKMIEPVVADTYGVIIYQEQVMQIAQVLSGYSLGEADLLRRAMGKKIKAEMQAQRKRFVDGALANGVDKARAEYIFDMVDKFAGYGFNKSHSAAYALVAYQTAWLKANYPVEFLAASMTLDLNNTDKLALFKQEADNLGIEVVPPCINRSEVEFSVKDGKIIYAFTAIRNVGRQAAISIVEAREADGPFKDLSNLAARLEPRHVNKRALENMSRAGVFDVFEANRAKIHGGLEMILGAAGRAADNRVRGQNDLFSDPDNVSETSFVLPERPAWTPAERLAHEFDAIGFYLSGHPLDAYGPDLRALDIPFYKAFGVMVREKGHGAGQLAGTVTYRKERKSAKSGNRYAFVGFSDPTGQYEAIIFGDELQQYQDLLVPGRAVLLRVEANLEDDDIKLRLLSIKELDAATIKRDTHIQVFMREAEPLAGLKSKLDRVAGNGGGPGNVSIVLLLDEGACEVEINLPGSYQITTDIISAIKESPGIVAVERN